MSFEIWRLLNPATRVAVCLCGMSLALGLTGCHDEDRRQEKELCMNLEYFAPEVVCGTPEDALRVNRLNFGCVSDPSCRIENVRGPSPRVYDNGRTVCCYSYTTVYPDDGSYVN